MKRHALFLTRKRQSGFTIVEMMVALSIGLIVLLGVAVTFVSIKQTFLSQDKLAQLQDNERLAMTVLTTAAQEAGYYPNAVRLDNTQITTTSDATYGTGTMTAGQAIYGTVMTGSAPTSHSLSLAFAASANDGLITCQGHTIVAGDIPTAGAAVGVRETFFVDQATNTLKCAVWINGASTGAAQSLITNVKSMTVLYGMPGATAGSVAGYWPPTSSAVVWSNVQALRLTVNFVNPNNASTPIAWLQTINLLNQ